MKHQLKNAAFIHLCRASIVYALGFFDALKDHEMEELLRAVRELHAVTIQIFVPRMDRSLALGSDSKASMVTCFVGILNHFEVLSALNERDGLTEEQAAVLENLFGVCREITNGLNYSFGVESKPERDESHG